jgi:hypothetical protein
MSRFTRVRGVYDILFDRNVDEGKAGVAPLLNEGFTSIEDMSWHRPIAYRLVRLKHECRLQLCFSEWASGEGNPAEDGPQADGGASVEVRQNTRQ